MNQARKSGNGKRAKGLLAVFFSLSLAFSTGCELFSPVAGSGDGSHHGTSTSTMMDALSGILLDVLSSPAPRSQPGYTTGSVIGSNDGFGNGIAGAATRAAYPPVVEVTDPWTFSGPGNGTYVDASQSPVRVTDGSIFGSQPDVGTRGTVVDTMPTEFTTPATVPAVDPNFGAPKVEEPPVGEIPMGVSNFDDSVATTGGRRTQMSEMGMPTSDVGSLA